MDHAWQDLLLHYFKEGQKWVRDLDRADWRSVIYKQSGTVPELAVLLVKAEYEAQSILRTVNSPAATGVRKGFVVKPGKFGVDALTVLVPYVLEDGANPRLSLQLGVYERVANHPERFFGYRFESPEAHDEHKYHHAQPSQAFGHGQKLTGSVGWYPDRYPTFPLAASDGAELVVALATAFREWDRLLELQTANTLKHYSKTAVGNFLKKIHPQ